MVAVVGALHLEVLGLVGDDVVHVDDDVEVSVAPVVLVAGACEEKFGVKLSPLVISRPGRRQGRLYKHRCQQLVYLPG